MTVPGFTVGDLTVYRIVEMEIPFADPLDFIPGLTRSVLDENRGWLEPAALDPATGKLVLCFQSYVVRTPHHTILVDSCIGNDKDRPARPPWHQKTDQTYLRGLKAADFVPEDIDFVLCTHLHPDHVGWNTKLADGRWVPTFSRARYVFARREYEYWSGEHANAALNHFADSVLPVVDAGRADLVGNEHAIGDHVTLTPTPGHTPDHVAVELRGGGTRAAVGAVLTGDLIHSPLQARYPELSMRVDFDPAQAAVTRRSFLERMCDQPILCCTAHFPQPSVGHIKRWGEGFRCEPV